MRVPAVAGCLVVLLGLAACERQQEAIRRDLPAAGSAKAQSDVRQIAAAVRLYQAAHGALPDSLEALVAPPTAGGAGGGPFLASIPAPPPGWSPYEYTRLGGDRFTVASSRGAVTVVAP